MRVNDALLGMLLILIAGALWFGAGGLANPTMQPYGPGFFPRILAALLAIASVVMVVQGVRRHESWTAFETWARDPRALARVLLVVAGILLFVFFMNTIGFIVCGALLVAALALANGVRPVTAIATGLIAALVVHSVFYLGLNVQLPWGLLAPVRW